MTGWLGRRAEDVLSALLAVMFVAFMLQIVTRYVLNAPLSWTAELSTLCWVWGILWGAGLVLRDDEEIRFDILYSVYLIFAVATIIRHAATVWRVLTGRRILGGGA